MKKLFPEMFDRPDHHLTIALTAYWAIAFVLFPVLIRTLVWGMYNQLDVLVWCEIIYNALVLAGVLVLCREYLQDSAINVQISPTRFAGTVAAACGLVIAYCFVLFLLGLPRQELLFLEALPIHASSLMIDAWGVALQNPLWGTLCMVLVCPIATCCLFYAIGFAPLCTHHPVPAYFVGALVASLPRLLGYLTMSMYSSMLPTIVLQLPIHVIACWSYQKSDTIWAPIATHSVVNLLTCLLIGFMHDPV